MQPPSLLLLLLLYSLDFFSPAESANK